MTKYGIALFLAGAMVAGCSSGSSTDTPPAGTGGSVGAGGSSAGAGGGSASGGASGTGGSVATGGVSGAGGSSASGGNTGSADAGTASLWTGINLSSAEWGTALPGTYGKDYTYPTPAEIDRYTGVGMTLFRIPFRWERLQQSLDGDLDATELAHLDAIVNYTTGKSARAIIDPHNYARYNNVLIGSGTVTSANLADLWGKLAAHYASNPLVVFGLMNEPHDITVTAWLDAANASVAAIRAAGANNLILVPGTNWTGAATWTSSNDLMLNIVDSANNYVYEVHQYLDSDSSGTHTTCVSTTIGTERLMTFMTWLATNKKKAFLGEFGAGATADTQVQDQTCATALDSMLALIQTRPDLWRGWTYWAGGPWWKNGTSFAIADTATPWQLTLLESRL